MGISTADLRRLLGREIGSIALAEAIDQLGCDLKELSEVVLYECPACGTTMDRLPREDAPVECDACGHRGAAPFPKTGGDERIRLDLVPARPDLFNAMGLARALRGFLGLARGLPAIRVPAGEVTVEVDPAVRGVRPFIACAEVTVPPLTREQLVLTFRLQEDLHWGVGRDRKKASIGVYDLEKHGTAIRYTTLPPDFRFTPLGMAGRSLSLAEILAEHPKGRAYAGLLAGFDRYPVLVDAAGRVLSMPPIINSEETKLAVGSRRLFVDVTGTDERAVLDSLALLVTDLLELGGEARSVGITEAGAKRLTPDLAPARYSFSPARAAALIGVPLTSEEVQDRLERMRLSVEPGEKAGEFTVLVPRYRVDVKHEVDLIEDVAIAHGYENLPSLLVPTMTVGEEHPRSVLGRKLRAVFTGLGFVEVVNFVLTNREDHYAKMRLPGEFSGATIRNPISPQQEIVRVHLLSGLMADFALNKTREMPQPIFEIGDVVTATAEGTIQRPHLAIGVMGPRADFATLRSLVDALAAEFAVPIDLRPLGDDPFGPVFLPGRAAALWLDGKPAGVLGEVHPAVVVGWGLDHPVVLAEVDLAALLPGGAG
ncbi:MAG: phenylalanine--tRNA ligase subunit beta [Planctomycetes bacterium]|nr:phenylalanine--tRNA ligase subunit beta [Planctomycetota bacterium]